jgi:DnaJ family protein C protein 28
VEEQQGPRDWENWIDEKIREAQERGQFDDLPGKGKPLDLTPNPYAKEQELAFKMLKDAGYAPEWIELDKAIRDRLERARATLARGWEWRATQLHELIDRDDSWSLAERERVLAVWERAVVSFQLEVAEINKEIGELNLKVPSARFQRTKVDPAREVARLTLGKAGDEALEPRERMAETVRQVVGRRERAPRSPRMERALKRLIWRYTRPVESDEEI